MLVPHIGHSLSDMAFVLASHVSTGPKFVTTCQLDTACTGTYRYGTSMLHDCFADEIAIDFPSVEPVVERMREAFLGDRDDDVLKTELRVSQREASGGLIVPIELPIRGTCHRCGGRGETWTEPCELCAGTGASLVHHPVRVSLPRGVSDGACLRFRVSSPGAPSVRVEVRIAVRSTV